MIDNKQKAQEHFNEKAKEYKSGTYFVTSLGQIFEEKILAKESARGAKVFEVEKTGEKKKAPTKAEKAKAKKEAKEAEEAKDKEAEEAKTKEAEEAKAKEAKGEGDK